MILVSERTGSPQLKAELLQGFYLGELFIEPLQGRVTGRGFAEHLTPKAAEVLYGVATINAGCIDPRMTVGN